MNQNTTEPTQAELYADIQRHKAILATVPPKALAAMFPAEGYPSRDKISAAIPDNIPAPIDYSRWLRAARNSLRSLRLKQRTDGSPLPAVQRYKSDARAAIVRAVKEVDTRETSRETTNYENCTLSVVFTDKRRNGHYSVRVPTVWYSTVYKKGLYSVPGRNVFIRYADLVEEADGIRTYRVSWTNTTDWVKEQSGYMCQSVHVPAIKHIGATTAAALKGCLRKVVEEAGI